MKEYVIFEGRRYLLRKDSSDKTYILKNKEMKYIGDGGGRYQISKPTKLSEKELTERFKSELIDKMKYWKKRFLQETMNNISTAKWKILRMNYTREEIVKLIVDGTKDTTGSFTEAMKSIGLTRAAIFRFKKLMKSFENDYTLDHLLELIVEYAFGKYKQIYLPKEKFYYKHPKDTVFGEDDLFHMNVDYDGVSEKQIRADFQCPKQVFYHCTNSSAAIHIMSHGPASSMGRKCLDFGITPSFYMTPDLDTALEWGKKSSKFWGGEVTIIVFSLDKTVLSKYKDLSGSEWELLVKSSRQCKVPKNELDKYHFVYGPMAANPEAIRKGGTPRTHSLVKYQLAGKGIDADDVLNDSVVGILWLEKKG